MVQNYMPIDFLFHSFIHLTIYALQKCALRCQHNCIDYPILCVFFFLAHSQRPIEALRWDFNSRTLFFQKIITIWIEKFYKLTGLYYNIINAVIFHFSQNKKKTVMQSMCAIESEIYDIANGLLLPRSEISRIFCCIICGFVWQGNIYL
jgi:hypothetical protein